MDFWYELAIRQMAELEDETAKLRRDAEAVLPPPAAERADEEDE